MKQGILMVGMGLGLCVMLAACSEKPQQSGTRKADVAAFNGATPAYMAQGWKAGDAGSWEAQLKTRAQGQNEKSRLTQ
jgi:hypothetical protein